MAYISNSNNNTLLVGTAEDDDIYNHDGSSVTINGLAGNDNIGNYGSSVTIDGGVGDDYIASNYGYSVTIDGGNGNDSISTFRGNLITIDGGTGDDDIHNWSDSVTINGGDGNDSIYNGNGSISNSSDEGGSNVSINVGDGDDSITTWGDSVTIEGGTGNNYIVNYGSSVTINVSDGNDTITNLGTNVSINAGAGNDIINNSTSYTGDESGVLIETGWHSDNVTINSSTGNDLISTYSDGFHVYFYNEGDGHDTIFSRSDSLGGNTWATYSDNYSLQINSASPWSSVVSGNDIVVTVGDGSITLVDAATSSGININGVTYPIDTTATVPAPVDPTPDTITPDPTPDTVTPVATAVPTDVVFIIDNTGSMSPYIENVKTAIISFAKNLDNAGAGYRLGLVEFGDLDKSEIKVYGFTDRDTFIEWVDSISLTNGVDLPESGLEAITAATTMDFMPGSNKRFIVVSDADFYNLGEDGDGTPSTYYQTEAVQALLNANAVKMDVVGTMGTNCQTEYEPLANATGGKFYDINNLAGGEVLEEIADDILGRSHVNINLDTDSVPEGTVSGVFVVTPTLNAVGQVVPASSDATFKAAAEEGDYVVGYVVAPNAYMAVPESPWRQIVTIPENWTASGTWQDDALNITGSNVVVSGSIGKDNISINEGVTNVTLVDVTELQNGSDTLSFSTKITPGTLQQTFTGGGVALYTTNESGKLDFVINLPGIVALDESLLNCEVSNAGTPNTIRELIYGEVNLPIFGGQDLSGRIMLAQWGYGFTPPEWFTGNATLATSADLAEDFGSPTLDEISPANFAVTANDMSDPNLTAFNPKVAEMILSAGKPKF